MLLVGLTGSIGMGKSTTAQIFRDLGVHDSDAAAHEIYRTTACDPIQSLFPGVVGSEGVNRKALADIVLFNPDALKSLEAIVHPLVSEHRRNFVQARAAEGTRVVVCDIPLMFETGASRDMDLMVVVSASAAVHKARVLGRADMTLDRFSVIMKKQMPDAEKRHRAHVIIDTGRGLLAARRQVINLLRALATRVQAS
jgi:dephospho-CoA kinase